MWQYGFCLKSCLRRDQFLLAHGVPEENLFVKQDKKGKEKDFNLTKFFFFVFVIHFISLRKRISIELYY